MGHVGVDEPSTYPVGSVWAPLLDLGSPGFDPRSGVLIGGRRGIPLPIEVTEEIYNTAEKA
jgi:hypothetical protein